MGGKGGVGWGNSVHVNLNTHGMLCISVIWGGRVGWGGAITFMSTWTRMECYAYLWYGGKGGVGWGNNVHVNLNTHGLGSSLALAHTRHAMLWHLLLHLHTHVMLRSGIFSCTCTHTHTSCYAPLWHLLLHLHTHVMHSWLSQWNIDYIIDTCMQYMKFPLPMSKFNVPNHTRNAMKNMFFVIPKLVSDAVIFNTEMNERYVNNESMMISQKTTWNCL